MRHFEKVLVIGVLIVVVMAAGCIGQEQPKQHTQDQPDQITQPAQTAETSGLATLTIDSQPVEILTNGNWATASNGTSLQIGTSVRTGSGGSAAITLGDNSIFRMDENTEVNVSSVSYTESSSNVQLYQRVGNSWTKVLGIGSGADSLEVSTPTTVATVRGTAFSIDVDTDGNTNLTVGEGQVDTASYKIEEQDGIKRRVETMRRTMMENETAIVKKALIDTGIEVAHAEKLSAWIEENRLKDANFIGDGQKRIMRRYVGLFNAVKTKMNLNDTEAVRLIMGALAGQNVNVTDPVLLQMCANFKEDIVMISEKNPDIARIITMEIGRKAMTIPGTASGIDYSSLVNQYGQYINITG